MALETQLIRSVSKNYGERDTNQKYGGRNIQDLIKTAVWTFDYDDVPFGSGTAATETEQVIPANSTIVSAKLRVVEAFTSTSTTSDMAIGTSRASDGVTVASNGLLGVADLTQTTIAVAGDIITGTGATVGSSVGANDVQLRAVYTVNDMLTGRAEVIVEYMTPGATPA